MTDQEDGPRVIKMDLADLLGSPHQTFTKACMRGMVEDGKVTVLRDEDGKTLGYGTVQEREDGHFELVFRVDTKNSVARIDADLNTHSMGFGECTSPRHGKGSRT